MVQAVYINFYADDTVNPYTSMAAKGAWLITTKGLRDALEMRRGIREEQYNNRYTNVEPLVPRYLRMGVGGRLDRRPGLQMHRRKNAGARTFTRNPREGHAGLQDCARG